MVNKVNKLADYFDIKLSKNAADANQISEKIKNKIKEILFGYFPTQYSREEAGLKKKNMAFKILLNLGKSERLVGFKTTLEFILRDFPNLNSKDEVLQLRDIVYQLTKGMDNFASSDELMEECREKAKAFSFTQNYTLTYTSEEVVNSISNTLHSIINLLNFNVIDNLDSLLDDSETKNLPKVRVDRNDDNPYGTRLKNTPINRASALYARCLGVEPRMFGKLTKFLEETGYPELGVEAINLMARAVKSNMPSNYVSYDMEFKTLRKKIRELVSNERAMEQAVNKIQMKSEEVVPRAYPTYKKLSSLKEATLDKIENHKIDKQKGLDIIRELDDLASKRKSEEDKFDGSGNQSLSLTLPEEKFNPEERESHLDKVREEASDKVVNIDLRIKVITSVISTKRNTITAIEQDKSRSKEVKAKDIASIEKEILVLEEQLKKLRLELPEAVKNKNSIFDRVRDEQDPYYGEREEVEV